MRARWTLIAICSATFMLLLDITIVQVALPSIARRLHGSLTSLQWTVDAYALPLSALVVTLGTLSDRWGRRAVFLGGVAGFTAASVACGAAQSMGQLVAARCLQGTAGAAVFATTLALIGQEFSGPARGRAITAWGATVGAAIATGPLLGGVLVDDLGWRWIFLVNVPIGLLVVVLTLRFVAEGRDTARPVDWPGLASLSAGLSLVTAGLLRGADSDWSGRFGPAALVTGAVLLVVFARTQRRPAAMLDAALTRNPAFLGVSAAVLALGAGMFAMFLFLTVYLQDVLSFSPLQSGLRLLPTTLPVFLVPFLARRAGLSFASGRVIGVGMLLVSAGLVAMAGAGATTSWTRLLPGLLAAGIGIGLANPAIAATALSVVPPQRSGLAAGASNTCRLAGIALGVAVLGGVLHGGIAHRLPGATPEVVRVVASGHLRDAARLSPAGEGVDEAYTFGLRATLLTGAGLTGLGALCALSLVRVRRDAPATVAAAVPVGA